MSTEEDKKAKDELTSKKRDKRPQELEDSELKDITGGLKATGGVTLLPTDTDGCISDL
jgi:hypothetical protein